MATAAFVAPHFIQEDFFTQDLMQDLHRLEGRRAQAQDDYQRQASDDIAATLLHYTMELEDMRLIMRDRLLALTLGHGDEVDDALVRGSFGGPTSQAQAQPGAVTGHTSELGGNIIPGLAALELEPDEERRAPNSGPRRLNPRATPVALAEPRAILPRVVASGAGLLDSPPPVYEELFDFPTTIEPPCPICIEPTTVETSTFHECGHQYHVECLRDWLLSTLPEKRLPHCTHCSEPVPSLTQLRSLDFPLDELARLQAEYTELATPLGRRLHCPRPSCGSFLGSIDAPTRACGKCERDVCTRCREVIWGTVEEHVCGVTEEDAVIRLAKDSGWQRCNSCRSLVERISGCHRIPCRCGSQFCYQCGAAWKTCGC